MKYFSTVLAIMACHVSWAQWSGTNPVYFTGGNVGIGITTPVALLDIKTSVTGPHLYFSTHRTFANSRNWGFLINSTAEGDFAILESASNSTAPSVARMLIDVNGMITATGNFTTNTLLIGKAGATLAGDTDPFQIVAPVNNGTHDLILYGNSSASTLNLRMYDGDLKLGSGTTPNTVLSNSGAATFGGTVTAGGVLSVTANQIRFSESRGLDYNPTTHALYYNGSTSQTVMLGDPSGNGWFLGNLGIGTSSPDARLAVNGQVHAQEVKVDLNGAIAPDYVFNKDYRLPSLDQIKSFVAENNHLPEVPSANEMEANGLNLGEMNLLLLKKVEELTLYLIEQNKTIDELKSENRRQTNAIESLSAKINKN